LDPSVLTHSRTQEAQMAMLRMRWATALAVVVTSLAMVNCSGGAGDESSAQTGNGEFDSIQQLPSKAVCGRPPRAGMARCYARVRTDAVGNIVSAATPQGFGPPDLRSAYKLPSTGGNGKTVAIVDAYDDPNAESDLATYRAQYGLPPCTTANGCFKKVNQSGQTTGLPSPDSGWAGEIALDLDMVSAACPDCKIILVEVSSPTQANLGAGVNAAVSLGAIAVSNSYGGPESSSDATSDAQYFNHPGVTITAATGDNGYGVSYPASSKYVTAVGGTSLVKSTGTTRGWAESVWSSAGSGCSAYTPKPTWQKDTGCSLRAVGDVSADADPNTGVAVYDTYGGSGWQVYGGTSASTPFVAASYVVLGLGGVDPSFSYSHTSGFYDVTSGSNGSCGGSYLCTGKAGYDGPTGNGTPDGTVLQSGGGTPVDAGTPPPVDAGGGGAVDSGTPPKDAGGGAKDSGGGGTTTCAHAICSSGTMLASGCDPCATKVCASDSYCCNTAWDSICVGEVKSVCGETCTGGGGGGGGTTTCSHAICSTGTKLTSTCDSCATKICGSDPYCCNTQWDNVCVGEVGSICGETCP
jgi:hypothetical protein